MDCFGRQPEGQIGSTDRFITCLNDPRDQDQLEHTLQGMGDVRIRAAIRSGADADNRRLANRGTPAPAGIQGLANEAEHGAH
jgi:hypothetical protein